MARPRAYVATPKPDHIDRRKTRVPWDTAKCLGVTDQFFFDPTDKDLARARKLCYGGCPIQDMCLLFGLTQQFGVWGGATEKQRRAMRVQTSYVTCHQCSNFAVKLTHPQFTAEVCVRCGIWHSVK